MKTNHSHPAAKVAYTISFGPRGTELVVHPKSIQAPSLQGNCLLISRLTMASVVRRWRMLGAPELVLGINAATTATLSLGKIGQLQLCTP